MSNKTKNAVDALYDMENEDQIILMDEKGNELIFNQVAVFPVNDDDYAILVPETKIEGVEEDQGLVFKIIQAEKPEDRKLEIVTDEKIVDEVFEEFERLCEEYEQHHHCHCCDCGDDCEDDCDCHSHHCSCGDDCDCDEEHDCGCHGHGHHHCDCGCED